jgi:hypothetical protein
MTVPTPRRHAPAPWSERASNWLALLALLALGIVWPGAEAARLPRSAHTPACAAPLAQVARRDVVETATP